MKLVLASSNAGKLEELRGLLADTGIEIRQIPLSASKLWELVDRTWRQREAQAGEGRDGSDIADAG